jgi:nicotinamidase-related amidase
MAARPNKIFGPLEEKTVHLCIDMQRLFAPGGPWPTPWLKRTVPNISRICGSLPTIFTRFVPPATQEDAVGSWRRYYERWSHVTGNQLDAGMLDLVPELQNFASEATIFDKGGYSAFSAPDLGRHLSNSGIRGLVITGTETDVCVLATVLDAVDLGLRTMVVSDGVCSSSDESHDALLDLFTNRFSEQVEVADTVAVLQHAHPS